MMALFHSACVQAAGLLLDAQCPPIRCAELEAALRRARALEGLDEEIAEAEARLVLLHEVCLWGVPPMDCRHAARELLWCMQAAGKLQAWWRRLLDRAKQSAAMEQVRAMAQVPFRKERGRGGEEGLDGVKCMRERGCGERIPL